MDYVVFGTGFGASVLVLGLVVRELGPRIRFRTSAEGGELLHAEELVAKLSWSRFCIALGSMLAIAGTLYLAATLGCILFTLSDSTGGWVMLGTLAAILLLMMFWTWAYFDRFGSYGILPEREVEPEPITAPARDQAPQATETANPIGPELPSSAVTADSESPAPVIGPTLPEHDSADPEPSADADSDDDRPPTVEADDSTPLETPEERLAHLETPLEHGSAEAELDIATGTGPRPSPRRAHRRDPRVTRERQGGPDDAADEAAPNDVSPPPVADDTPDQTADDA